MICRGILARAFGACKVQGFSDGLRSDTLCGCVRRRLLLTMAHPVRRNDVKTFVQAS